jgi:hypothetical protein
MPSFMRKRCVMVLALALMQVTPVLAGVAHRSLSRVDADSYPEWRSAAATVLAARDDAGSLATAAALTFLASPSHPKLEGGRPPGAAQSLAVKASELAPNNPAISWLRLMLCTNTPGCDVRQAATTMRWLAADNGAAWLPTLTQAQRDKDAVEVDRVLVSMAEGEKFELYGNRTTVMIFGALKRARAQLPPHYLRSDDARLNEALGISNAVVLPSFSPLINACRDPEAGAERREACLRLSRTMQHADMVMAQLVGFAIEKRLNPGDVREVARIAERRRTLETRVALANQANVTVRARLAKMRALPREEDVYSAIVRDLKKSFGSAADHRPAPAQQYR